MNHLMIDLESLGQTPLAPILSVGAVFFDNKEIKLEREWHLEIEEQLRQGRKPDFSTICWWMTQSDKAREIFNKEFRHTPVYFTGEFNQFCRSSNMHNPKLWGNGASFDIPILESLLKKNMAIDAKLPWQFWDHRCFRTIKAITNCDKKIPFEGEKHSALTDARHQAKCLIELWKERPELER